MRGKPSPAIFVMTWVILGFYAIELLVRMYALRPWLFFTSLETVFDFTVSVGLDSPGQCPACCKHLDEKRASVGFALFATHYVYVCVCLCDARLLLPQSC